MTKLDEKIQAKILALLKKIEVCSPTEIARECGVGVLTAGRHLMRLTIDGKVIELRKLSTNFYRLRRQNE